MKNTSRTMLRPVELDALLRRGVEALDELAGTRRRSKRSKRRERGGRLRERQELRRASLRRRELTSHVHLFR